MLISKVGEESGSGEVQDAAGEEPAGRAAAQRAQEYRTASELFDLMAKNQNFQPNEDASLTTRDLVLLYKNIDLGTKLMSNVNEFKLKAPNQYVETIVYEDFDSDSELGEIYSTEDIHNVVLINEERIDLLNNPPSLENTLCQKFGDLEIKGSGLSTDYNRKFVFKDPFIKEQLKSLNLMPNPDPKLPVSLLDYMCCKRLEDNYNFYMENIIRHVKYTIDQLKRISNGDYLTDRAKEKWREIGDTPQVQDTPKVLSNSTSIPLYVEAKTNGNATKWDDLVHSEMDIRSLSKILEKKIVVEVPKSICGSYKLFSKCCNDNLIISCTREKPTTIPEKVEKSRVDLVLQLDRSNSGHVISNISSIMILQKKTECSTESLPLLYKDEICSDTVVQTNSEEGKITITELTDDQGNNEFEDTICPEDYVSIGENTKSVTFYDHLKGETNIACFSEFSPPFKSEQLIQASPRTGEVVSWQSEPYYGDLEVISTDLHFTSVNSKSSIHSKRNHNRADEIVPVSVIQPDELRITIQRLNMQASLQEEESEDPAPPLIVANKKKSPTRNRIKSPYENKSLMIEEKKRKRLLEVRQRREKKKLALTDKLNKQKYAKGVISPHNASSITKLSITNKSFYDSIYGHPGSNDHKTCKIKGWKDKKDSIPESFSETDNDVVSVDRDTDGRKYIDKNYYLDDAVTEMEMVGNENQQRPESDRSSFVSSELNTNLQLLSQLITPSIIRITINEEKPNRNEEVGQLVNNIEQSGCQEEIYSSANECITPVNTQRDDKKVTIQEEEHLKKVNTSAEFRKSIDKIYELINKLGKNEGTETKLFKSKFTAVSERANNGGGECSTIHCTDSGTSVKHKPESSVPSFCSFDKANLLDPLSSKPTNKKNVPPATPPTVEPKVIISTKVQNSPKVASMPEVPIKEIEKNKKDRRKHTPNKYQTDNPLKAISQLLQEFDNVQEFRNKATAVPKGTKKSEVKLVEFADAKMENRQTLADNRSLRMETHVKDKEYIDKHNKTSTLRERKAKLSNNIVQSRFLSQSNNQEQKPVNKVVRKKVADIVEEMKEARGEAVRGPPRSNARLNSLAQPKKTYVQAQIEEFQAKYGKSLVTDRLQRLTGPAAGQGMERNVSSPKLKKRSGSPNSKNSLSLTPTAASEIPPKKLSNNNNRETCPPANDQSLKHSNVPDTPALKKKMVAVESYVKNHYGRPSPNSEPNELSQCSGQKSRVPFFPIDMDQLSLMSSLIDESSQKSQVSSEVVTPQTPPNLSVTQCNENTPKQAGEESYSDSLVANNDSSTYGSDSIGVRHFRLDTIIGDTIPEENENYVQPHINKQPSIETKLENTLHGHISMDAIQRMKLKKAPLTPTESMKQLLLWQSGDSNSMLMKSFSQNFNSTNDKALNIFPEVSSFNFSQFPMQIATVGYSFPHFQRIPFDNNEDRTNIFNSASVNTNLTDTNHSKLVSSVSSQCFKGGQIETRLENSAQVDVKEFITISSILKFSSTVIKEENEEIENEDNLANNSTNNKKKCDIGAVTETACRNNLLNEQMINNSTKNCNTCDIGAVTEPLRGNDISTTVSELFIQEAIEQQQTNIQKERIKDETPGVEYTTSLDILVGLLNEIHRISTCQTQMTTSETEVVSHEKEVEHILKSGAALEKIQQEARNIISIASLEKLRHLESNTSLYSFYLSNPGDKDFMETKLLNLKPVYADKEVDAIVPARQLVSKCTDVPSVVFPITVNEATDTSNSLTGILSEPSSQSVMSNRYSLHPNESLTSLKRIKKIIKLSEVDSVTEIDQHAVMDTRRVSKATNREVPPVNMEKLAVVPMIRNNCYGDFHSDLEPLMRRNIEPEMDNVMKMKRDILVTMYSVLVFTVFAALSFPEILYRG